MKVNVRVHCCCLLAAGTQIHSLAHVVCTKSRVLSPVFEIFLPAMGDIQFSIRTLVYFALMCCVSFVDLTDPDFLSVLSSIDVTKINISQEEYSRMMTEYLNHRRKKQDPDLVPRLIVYSPERKTWRRTRDNFTKNRFLVPTPEEDVIVDSAELRLLAPSNFNRDSIKVRVYQILPNCKRNLLDTQTLYISEEGPKWQEFDVTSAVQAWMKGERNMGLHLECVGCDSKPLRPITTALNVLVLPKISRRKRATLDYLEGGSVTDCNNQRNTKRPKCCRHSMQVSLQSLLNQNIYAPRLFDAGYCQGRCPLNHNFGTNHSRIQRILHKKNSTAAPRTCCAPAALDSLEILYIDPKNVSSLTRHVWDKMIVTECACF